MSTIKDFPSLHELVKEDDFELEVLCVEPWLAVVHLEGLEHQVAAREQIAFNVKLSVCCDQPEVKTVGVDLDSCGRHAVELLHAVGPDEVVQILLPEYLVLSVLTACSVI